MPPTAAETTHVTSSFGIDCSIAATMRSSSAGSSRKRNFWTKRSECRPEDRRKWPSSSAPRARNSSSKVSGVSTVMSRQLRKDRARRGGRIGIFHDRPADDDVVGAGQARVARGGHAALIAVRAAARANAGAERDKLVAERALERGDFVNRTYDAGAARVARQPRKPRRVLRPDCRSNPTLRGRRRCDL